MRTQTGFDGRTFAEYRPALFDHAVSPRNDGRKVDDPDRPDQGRRWGPRIYPWPRADHGDRLDLGGHRGG